MKHLLDGFDVRWEEVWRLTLDRRAGEVVVLLLDGRKLRRPLEEESHTKERRNGSRQDAKTHSSDL